MNEKHGIPVLVTGFGPFGSHKVNVSWEIAKILPKLNLESRGVRLILHEFPVSYLAVNEQVPELWKKHKPQLVIHMGLTSVGSEIALETLAHKNGYVKLDVCGKLPENGSAIGKHEILRTNLNAHKVKEILGNSTEVDVPIKVSTNAGRYLCEYIFYTSLNIDNTRTIFIHLPDTDKGFSLMQMAQVVNEILLLLLEQIINKTCLGNLCLGTTH